MSERRIDCFTKYATEARTVEVDFQPVLAKTGTTISSAAVEAVIAGTTTDVSGTIVPGGASFASSVVSATVVAGAINASYSVTLFATLSDGQVAGHRVEVTVR